ncbi:MAG: response regulator [Deltaproteobacteria bacterium]|nr:response regulator [Deltaproteobacteria bacterium]
MSTILIVDDDRHARALLARVFLQDPTLQKYSVEVLVAGDGEEGLQVLGEQKPDVVICDLLMPRMDGFRFCEAMRRTPHGMTTGLIVVSGLYRDPTVSKRIREEFRGVFYTKPYQLKDLAAAVGKILAARAQGRTGTSVMEPLPAPPPDVEPPPLGPLDGDLGHTPLPRLLLDLFDERATGLLEIRRGKIEKRIEMVVGHPTAVSSNQRQEALGHFLVSKGAITETQHQQALERARDEGEKLGEALVELGFLTAHHLSKFLTSQARFKITGALRWPDGTWSYRPNRHLLERASGMALDPAAVVFLGLRNTANYEEAAQACERLSGRRIGLTDRGRRLTAPFARAFGDTLLATLEKRPTVEELLGEYDLKAVLPAIEALLLTGCAEASEHSRVTLLPKPATEPPVLDLVAAAAPQPAPQPSEGILYDMLFGEPPQEAAPGDGASGSAAADPDSAVIDLLPQSPPILSVIDDEVEGDVDSEASAARERLSAEALRVQGNDWYKVLRVSRDATERQVAASHAALIDQFALERYSRFNLGPDYAKLDELHAAYERAAEVLLNPELRQAYDSQLEKTGAPPSREALDAEIQFRKAEQLLGSGRLQEAIPHFHGAIRLAPSVADYHASLGWALFLIEQQKEESGTEEGRADVQVETSTGHLLQALAIDPDHPAAHEYLGRVLAETGGDYSRAAHHLERALDATPPREGAMAVLEELRTRYGDFKPLERQYRRLLHRLGDSNKTLALTTWVALAKLYRTHLGDQEAARIAYQCAARLSPDDPEILRTLADVTAGNPDRFLEYAEVLRAYWRLDRGDVGPGLELMRAALESSRHDAAFVAASILTARGAPDEEAAALYKRFRPRFLLRAQRPMDAEIWTKVRHPEDDPDIGAIFALLEPLAIEMSPMSLSDLDVGASNAVSEEALPEPFARVRASVAHALGVEAPPIYRRLDFADQIHVGATSPPVLLAGPDVLGGQNRVDLAFRMARAMSYLYPGRSLGGSRPSRLLKNLLLACISFAVPGAQFDDADGTIAEARFWLEHADDEVKARIVDHVARVTEKKGNLNLSRWARALARTGDRVGLLLAGDTAVAARAVVTLGAADAVDDLLDYAISTDHLSAREALGISIEV